MPVVSFDDGVAMHDATPLDNLFISEYMLRAPGDYVKVYLYMLMLCHHPGKQTNRETISKDLGISSEEMDRAIQYWVREGLARQVADNPPAYVFRTATQVAYDRLSNPGGQLYNTRFTEEIYRIFGEQDVPYQDLQKIYDWIDVYELPEEVVLMLLQNEKKEKNFINIRHAAATAKDWADRKIRTVEDVEKQIFIGKERELDLRRLLARLGQPRNASDDEKAMYNKWVDEWGFTADGIQEACRETTKGTPTMAYLDGILLRQHQIGNHDVKAIKASLSGNRTIREFAKQVLLLLGRAGTIPTEDELGYVIRWEDQKYEDEFVTMAARAVHRRINNANMEDVDAQLGRWVSKGIKNASDVQAETERNRQKNLFLKEVFSRCLPDRQRPSEQDRTFLTRWEDEFGMERPLILLAAEYAFGKRQPMEIINTILRDWSAANIHTVEAAKAEHLAHLAAPAGPGRTPETYQKHSQEERRESSRAAVVDLDG